MVFAAASQPSGSIGRPWASNRSQALGKLTVSRIVTVCSSAKTCRRCSTARRPQAAGQPSVGDETDQFGVPLGVVPVDQVLQGCGEAVVVLRGHDDEGVRLIQPGCHGRQSVYRLRRGPAAEGRERNGQHHVGEVDEVDGQIIPVCGLTGEPVPDDRAKPAFPDASYDDGESASFGMTVKSFLR